MKRKYLSLAIGSVLLTALASPVAWAQDAAPSDAGTAEAKATNLGAVTVTARKREETLQEVPVAVTAFTADALDKLNVEDLSDLDAQVPNLTIYAARGSSSTVTAYIRGVGQSDPLWGVDPGVGIYLDDVYIARPQGALLDVFDVERVEVLRGPQGTLYGKNTIGGAIKYISRGLSKDTEGFASMTMGSHDRLDVKAGLGGSVADGVLRGRIAAASLNRDGYGENLTNDQPVSDKEINAMRLELGAYASDDLNFQFAADWMDDQSGMRGGKLLSANTSPLANLLFPGLSAYQPLDDRYDIRSGMPNVNDTTMKGASATVNWRANENWSLKYVAAKRESDTETNIDFDMTPYPVADVKAFYQDSQVSHELQANFDAGGSARGVMGIYYFDGEAGGQVLNNFFGLSFGDTQGRVFTESLSFYTDWTFDLGEKWKLDVGARYTDEDKHAIAHNIGYTDNTFSTPNGVVAANFDKTINFKNVSPKISLDYEVTPDIMVYGLASRGFKSGGYNIRANTTAVPRSGEPFDDESVDSLEIGTKMGLLDQTLFLNLAAFHNVYKDIQLSVFTQYIDAAGNPQFFGDFTNAGKGTIDGAEVEYQWLPTEHWAISGNLAWLDAKYDEFITAGVNVADNQKFTNAPEFSGAVNVEWRTALAGGGNLSARVGYSYQSEVYPTTDLSEAIKQPGYGLVNAGVTWRVNDAWSFALAGTNLADEEYRTTGYNLQTALGVLSGFYGAPREYSLTARYQF
ncbi:TonB-dependent receptor [Lysobacter niabensis]|uniref:TonB-dependent receptor n=1 Tax=Agrilutibacter niabensis TaxID=380628 RepID=UPI00361E50A2